MRSIATLDLQYAHRFYEGVSKIDAPSFSNML